MILELIHGQFSKKDAIEIITQMIHVKIKFHESKISNESNQEDSKMRERRIKQLQRDLFEARKYIEQETEKISMQSEIKILSKS